MTQKPVLNLDYFTKKLRLCWSPEKLAEAAAHWPNPLTWAWFLGARLLTMSRIDAMERIQVAIAHLGAMRWRAPERPGLILAFFRTCSDAQLCSVGELFGLWLDDPDDHDRFEAFAAGMRGENVIIEAQPPSAAEQEQDASEETPPPQGVDDPEEIY